MAMVANDNDNRIKREPLGAATPWNGNVARDAARFIALHGPKVAEMSDALRELAATIPVGRPDLLQHWLSVARRIGKIVAARVRRPD
jgi:hypothetical protein